MNESIEFSKRVIDLAFKSKNIPASELIELSKKLELLIPKKYDPNKHRFETYSEILKPGQEVFVFSDKLKNDIEDKQ